MKRSIMPIKSGFRPGRYDSRDYIYSIRTSHESIADSNRLIIDHDVPVIDQGKIIPCCVSIAVSTCIEVLDSIALTPLSFMFNYFWARTNQNSLSSLDIRQSLNAAGTYGICVRSLHDVPLDRVGASTKPSQAAEQEAIMRRIAFDPAISNWAYEHFDNRDRVSGWRNAIQYGAPVIMGFEVTSAYKNISNTGDTHFLPINDVASDGHAVTVMGYDDNHDNGSLGQGAFNIRDSRGIGFADKGYWWMPYQLVETHLVVDSWAVIKLNETN
jgi:hypothetical protein